VPLRLCGYSAFSGLNTDDPAQRPRAARAATQPVHALRDPAIFEDADRTYLLYSTAGESGIAIAELRSDI